MIRKKILLLVLVVVTLGVGCGDYELKNLTTNEKPNKVSEKNVTTEKIETGKELDEISTEQKDELTLFERFMEEEKYVNPKDENGEYSFPYALFDFDNDGIDELIVSGGYINYQIYKLINEKPVLIGHNKYGGNLTIIPGRHMFFWTGGHKDHYFEELVKVNKQGTEIVASKSWVFNPRKGKEEKRKCKINSKSVTNKKYNSYISSIIESDDKLKPRELDWMNLKSIEQIEE